MSCGGNSSKGSLAEGASGDMEAYESGDVNAVEQARPQIMVIPADQTLKSFGALKETKVDGKGFVVRDYQKYLVKDDRFRRLASFIQDAFVKQNYPHRLRADAETVRHTRGHRHGRRTGEGR